MRLDLLLEFKVSKVGLILLAAINSLGADHQMISLALLGMLTSQRLTARSLLPERFQTPLTCAQSSALTTISLSKMLELTAEK